MNDEIERGMGGDYREQDNAVGAASGGASPSIGAHAQTGADSRPRSNGAAARDNIHYLPVEHNRAGPMTAADLHGLPSGDIGKSGFSLLARLCGALRAFDPESTGMRIPLVDLAEDDIRKIDTLLGRDGVKIDSTGDPVRKGYATRIAGVWRAHIETPRGDCLFEWLEIGDVPSFVRDLATMGASGTMPDNGRWGGTAQARSGGSVAGGEHAVGISRFMDKLQSAAKLFRHGQNNTSVPLDGLGHDIGSAKAATAARELRRRLGKGAVHLTSQSRAIRVHSTDHTHVWVVEYLPNGRPPEAKGMFHIEIGDVPAAMRAMPDDIEQSAIRFASVLERIVLGAPLASLEI